MSRLWIITVCLTLAGCGGGGGSSVSTWLKSEPASADKASQQLAQLGASDIPELPRIQTAASTSAPGAIAPRPAGGNQSLPAVDMSKSWSTSVEAAPLEDLPPLPTSGSAPAASTSPIVTVPATEASAPTVKEPPVLPSINAPGSGSLPALPTTPITPTVSKVAPISKAIVTPMETAAVTVTSPSIPDPYADRTAAYWATQKAGSMPAPVIPSTATKIAGLPSLTPTISEPVPTASGRSVQSESLPGLVAAPSAVKPLISKVVVQEDQNAPATSLIPGKRYLVFASFNESEKAKNLARRHARLGATVLASEVGGAPVYRVAVPVGKSAATKRRDLAAVGLTDAWPLRM